MHDIEAILGRYKEKKSKNIVCCDTDNGVVYFSFNGESLKWSFNNGILTLPYGRPVKTTLLAATVLVEEEIKTLLSLDDCDLTNIILIDSKCNNINGVVFDLAVDLLAKENLSTLYRDYVDNNLYLLNKFILKSISVGLFEDFLRLIEVDGMELYMSLNQWVGAGRAVSDPVVKEFGENKVATVRIAVNRSYKKGDEWVEVPLFIDCDAWGHLAERLERSVTKGTPLTVRGGLESREWTDKETGKKTSRIQVKLQEVVVHSADKKNADTDARDGGPQKQKGRRPNPAGDDSQSYDLPF